MTKTIFIAGSGGIGEAAALLLREWCDFELKLILGDISTHSLEKAKEFVTGGSEKTTAVETVLMSPDGINDEMRSAFEEADVLLDCSPGGQAPRMAGFAVDHAMHYANLTEYVAETEQIMQLGKNAKTGFILQTGLAPGFINVLAMQLYKEFVAKYENENVERIAMNLRAQHPIMETADTHWRVEAMHDDLVKDVRPAIFALMGAPDVAFTEAAVGAGVSTILFLATLALTRPYEKIPVHTPLLPIVTHCHTSLHSPPS